jgi:hypothetical protein
MEYTTPEKTSKGKDFEFSLLGSILGLSCIPDHNKVIDLFNNPSTTSKQEHDITERNTWQVRQQMSLC